MGDDSTLGIPYIWLSWPTVTYSFTGRRREELGHQQGDSSKEEQKKEQKVEQKKEQKE